MALADTTALSAVLKQKYTQRRFAELTYKKNPGFALIKKRTDFGGKNKVIALRNANPLGIGPSVSAAQGNKTASKYNQFVVTRASYYGTASITGEAILAAKGDENSLIEGLTKEIDGIINGVTRRLAMMMYRNGGGAIGQISSGSNVGTATITLANTGDITNFETGQVLQLASDDGFTGSAGVRAGTVTVKSVDVDAGTITATGNWTAGIGAAAASDFIFGNGDYQGWLKGALAWTPSTAPSAGESFFGLDRSTDPTRLAGVRHSGNGGPIEETLVDCATKLVRQGSTPDYVLMNPLDWANLVKALGSKVVYERIEKTTDGVDVGFKTVTVDGPQGGIKVVHDLNVPKGTAFMWQLDTWALESLGAMPKTLDSDGLMLLRSANSDDYEVRVGGYGNFTCEAPGWNAVITL